MEEDIVYKLTRCPLPREEVLRLFKEIRYAHVSYNGSPTLKGPFHIEGYLQEVTRENAWHLRQLAQIRADATGLLPR
jgi:hypothetical protein